MARVRRRLSKHHSRRGCERIGSQGKYLLVAVTERKRADLSSRESSFARLPPPRRQNPRRTKIRVLLRNARRERSALTGNSLCCGGTIDRREFVKVCNANSRAYPGETASLVLTEAFCITPSFFSNVICRPQNSRITACSNFELRDGAPSMSEFIDRVKRLDKVTFDHLEESVKRTAKL